MNYNEAYKMLINAVNEHIADPNTVPVVWIFEWFNLDIVDGKFHLHGIEYLESELITIDETTPQYILDLRDRPLEDFFGCRYFVSKDKSDKYTDAFSNILNQGLTYSATGVGTYILSSVETALHLSTNWIGEAIQNGFITLSPFSIYSSVETYLKFAEAGDVFDDTRDERLFLPSIDKLNFINPDRLSDKGVVESGDWSMILNLIKDIEKWAEIEGVDSKQFGRMFDIVLDRGFIFTQINEDEARISSIETYINSNIPA
jgi:hypothetical protein